MPLRRCWWYDDQGNPRLSSSGKSGCHNVKCGFVHPHHSSWGIAQSGRPPPPHLLARDSETLSRANSFSQDVPSSIVAKRSSWLSISPVRDSSPNRPSTSTHPREHSPSSHHAAEDIRDRTREDFRSGPSRPSMESPRGTPVRLQRPSPTPSMPPPPNPKKALSPEERLAVWVDRVKLMSDVVVARNEHVKLERDSHSFQRLINSSFYDDVSEEQKSRLDSELQDIQNQREAKKKELNDLVFRLRDMDFWPALPRPEGSLLTQEHQLTIRENINDLKRSVQELHDQLKTLNTPGTSHQGTTAEHPEAPPLKRRRLSVNEKTPPKAPSPDTQKSVTEMEDRLMTLELRISEMENNLVENQSTIYEELDSRMIERLEDMAVPQAKDPTPPSPPAPIPLSPQTLERLKGIEANLDQTGTEIVTIAEEIAELIVRGNTYEREVADLRNENAKLKEKITHLEVVQKQCLESSEKDRAEMKALNAAITAFISQPPASSTIPVEEIIRSLQPTLVNEVRKDLYSVLEDQRKAIHGVIQTRSTELSQPIMHNLAVTMQTVDTITRWMDKVNQSGGLHLNGLAKPPNKLPEK